MESSDQTDISFLGSSNEPFKAPLGIELETIDVLIPAHNEDVNLARTIHSVRSAFQSARRQCRIVVGVDACSDQTLDVAKTLADKIIIVNYASKWKTLIDLTAQGQTEWIAFVDVGSLWPPDLLKKFEVFEGQKQNLFIAPSYCQQDAGLLQSLHWKLESQLKKLENKLGGPVTVHGSTVFYRLAPLRNVLFFLNYRMWLNDDVIIPLTMRAQNPGGQGVYLDNVRVTDLPPSRKKTNRRVRISLGNLEIVEFLDHHSLELPWKISLLWQRRHLRIYWGYLFLFFIIGLVLLLGPENILVLAAAGALVMGLLTKKAFRVSLKAPFVRWLLKKQYTDSKENTKPPIQWH